MIIDFVVDSSTPQCTGCLDRVFGACTAGVKLAIGHRDICSLGVYSVVSQPDVPLEVFTETLSVVDRITTLYVNGVAHTPFCETEPDRLGLASAANFTDQFT